MHLNLLPVSVLRETVTPSLPLGSEQRCCAGSRTLTGRSDPSLDPWVPCHHREGLSGSRGLSRTVSAAFPEWLLTPPIFSSFQTQEQRAQRITNGKYLGIAEKQG